MAARKSGSAFPPPILAPGQANQLRREGFLVLRQVIPLRALAGVQAEIEDIVDEAAEEFHHQGRLLNRHKELNFLERIGALQAEINAGVTEKPEDPAEKAKRLSYFQNRNASARDGTVQKDAGEAVATEPDAGPVDLAGVVFGRFGFPVATPRRPEAGKGLFELMTCGPLLNLMEEVLGSSELISSGAYRIRPKLPNQESGIIPWHQDQCFWLPSSDPLPSALDWSVRPPVIAAWIPLMDVTPETGCMEFLTPAPTTLQKHYLANLTGGEPEWTIHPDHFPDSTTTTWVQAPAVGAGDVILFTPYAPHRSIPNTSRFTRWTVDLRYQLPSTGDFDPYEAGFLARSQKTPEKVVRNYKDFREIRTSMNPRELRKERKANGQYLEGEERRSTARLWKRADEETFLSPTSKGSPFEGDLEFAGRLEIHRKRLQEQQEKGTPSKL